MPDLNAQLTKSVHWISLKRLFPALLLFMAILAIYAPALRNEFVWDDRALVLGDPLIRSWRLMPEGFQHFLFTDATASDFYRPLQRLLHTIEYAAFGFQPAVYHATSIAFHFFAAVALFFFALEFLKAAGIEESKSRVVSLVAAFVWAIHPVHSSAVAYISGSADPMAGAFGFLGLYLGLLSLRTSGPRIWLLAAAGALSFLLSGLSKEAGLIFLALWLVIVGAQRNWQAAKRAGVATVFVLTIYLSLRIPAEHIPPPSPHQPMPALVRPILVARAIAEYAGLILLPVHLQMERDVETHPSGFSTESMNGAAWRELQTLAGIVLIAAFLYWLNRERKHDRAAFLLLLLAAISYLPVSGLVTLNATVAEHWLYLPTAFLFTAIGLVFARLFASEVALILRLRPLVPIALACWVLFLCGRTFKRTFDWKDQRTFLERTIATGGDSARMLINLGGLELSEGHFDEAKRNLEAALKKEPNEPRAVINLAAVAVKRNEFATAHQLLARAQQMSPVEAQAHELLTVLENKETGRANLLRLRLAARTGPAKWAIEKRYVKLLAEGGAADAAVLELKHCLATQWYRAESWQLLGEILAQAGREPEAEAARAQARRYDVRLDAGATNL